MPTMNLPVKLTDEEKLKLAEEDLSPALTALKEAKEEKREVVASHNATIKGHQARIDELNEALATGQVLREVEIEERHDFTAGMTYIHRLDTGECVKQTAIDPDERQVKLGMDGPKLGSVDGDKADEQLEARTPDEAEALRADRLAQERAERISAAVTEARAAIVVEALPEGGPAFRAVVNYGGRELAADGETEDAARDACADVLVGVLEFDEDAAAAADVPAPTWDEVKAASQAAQDAAEVERLAAEQATDDTATKKRTLKTGPAAKKDGLTNGGLKVPEGHKRKKAKGITVVDGDSGATLYDGAAEAAATGDEPPVLCPPTCDVDHRHTESRAAF